MGVRHRSAESRKRLKKVIALTASCHRRSVSGSLEDLLKMDFKLLLLLSLASVATGKSANDIISNEIDQTHISGGGSVASVIDSEASGNLLFPFISKTSSSSAAAAAQKSPQDDINVLAGAFLDSLFDHKAAIITSVVNLINWLLGGLLTEVRDFADRLLGRKNTRPQQQAPRKSSGFAERRDSQTFHDDDSNLFTMPYVERPITYDDIQLLERLVYDSVEVYRAWQEHK